jgi:hypothetical protein
MYLNGKKKRKSKQTTTKQQKQQIQKLKLQLYNREIKYLTSFI